jgi:adenylate cyclase
MLESMRILSAIMFTDIVGYTALMQTDEKRAKLIRDKHREVLEKLISSHQGKIIQYYGDGTLSIFASAVEAVKSAVLLQKEFEKDPKIPVRIGIHIGDIVYDNDGIYGDGVNVASRIESLSIPGAVLISDKINEELLSHPELPTKSMGKFDLKNVHRPVEVFALNVDGIKTPTSKDLKGKKQEEIKSIAVLPFVNMSADKENEYFSDGITEEILNALVKVKGLQVTARTSAFAFKGKNIDVREIGKQLNVHTVLEGSVRKSGDKVRVTAQLINSADGYHIWSEVYNRKLEDIFDLQDELSGKIANTLREKLTGSEQSRPLVAAPTENIEAYNLFLKGHFNINKWTPEGARKGIEILLKAIELEPEFASAYSLLAFCYTMLGAMGQVPANQSFPLAEEYADKALRLNDNLSEAHISKALLLIFDSWSLSQAKLHFEKAIELSPGAAGVYHAYSVYYLATENLEAALDTILKASQLDPLSLPINAMLAEVYMFAGNTKAALEQIEKTLELDPTFRAGLEVKGWIHFFDGDLEKSISTFLEYHSLVKDPLKGVTGLGYVYGKAGYKDKAKECLKKLDQRKKLEQEVSLSMDYLVIHSGLNNFDKALHYVEEAIKDGGGIFFIRSHPILKELRNDKRFGQLLEKYNLPR